MPHLQWVAKILIGMGILLAVIGAVLLFGSRIGLGRLPGDISFRKGGFSFYFPIVTCIIISIIITIILNLIKRK